MQRLITFLKSHKKPVMHAIALFVLVGALVGALSLTAFAQTTYVITDGEQVTVHTTFATDPAQILDEAGFNLETGDKYTTQETDGVSEITIQRAQTITIFNCGEQVEVQSYGETVEQLLTRSGIPTYGDYKVSCGLGDATFDGMQITVDYVLKNQQTYTVELPYETTYCYDDTLPEGEEVVLLEGSMGQAIRTDDVWYENYAEENRINVEETILKQPVNRCILKGTGENVGEERTKPLIGDGFIVTTDGQVLTYSRKDQFSATAYTKTDAGCDDITATGTQVRVGVVAVDPTVVPYGTQMFIVTNDGAYIYGVGSAEDCGGGIIGKHLDLYFETDPECWKFGMRNCTVYFLN